MFRDLLSNNDDFYDFLNSNLSLENSLSLIENPKPFYIKKENNSINIILFFLFIMLIIYVVYLFIKN